MKTAYPDTLNALNEMQGSVAYVLRRKTLADAERIILAQEREIEALKASAPSPLSAPDYKTLFYADIDSNGEVGTVLSRNGLASWTVCPACRVDDFTHVEGCELDIQEDPPRDES